MSSVLGRITDSGFRLRLDGERLIVSPASQVTDELRALVRAHRAELVAELLAEPSIAWTGVHYDAEHNRRARDARLTAVMDRLAAEPALMYAWETHVDVAPDHVIVTVAMREAGACELSISRERYDAFVLLQLIDKGTTA